MTSHLDLTRFKGLSFDCYGAPPTASADLLASRPDPGDAALTTPK
jgi:hypothetical protein